MFKFRKKSHQEVLDKIPNHIGIIMDGNGRWAKKRLQPRVMGHKAEIGRAHVWSRDPAPKIPGAKVRNRRSSCGRDHKMK